MRRAAESARAGICEGRVGDSGCAAMCARSDGCGFFFESKLPDDVLASPPPCRLVSDHSTYRCAGKMFTREPDERLRREVPPPPSCVVSKSFLY